MSLTCVRSATPLRLLVAGIGTGPDAWERCLRADRKKRGETCHYLRTSPYFALSWFGLYNTALKQIFPCEDTLSGSSYGRASDP